MGSSVQLVSSLIAGLVSLALAAWVLLRGARSAPTRLMAGILGCMGLWNGFEFLFLRHGIRTYVTLEFIGVNLAPCLLFHYAVSLARPSPHRRAALAVAYVGTAVFMAITLGALGNPFLAAVFWESKFAYNGWYLAFFAPLTSWAVGLLAWARREAADPDVRSLFTYPLAATLVMAPFGFLELTVPLGLDLPRFGSLASLGGSAVLATGVVRHRTIYDALATLRRDAASILRTFASGLMFVEAGGRVVFSSGTARELLGLDRAPKTLAEAGLSIPEGERVILRSRGRVIEVRAVKSADVVPAGRRSLIFQDRTRDFMLLETLASKEALASLGQAAATLAHEIRNPLTAILSSADCIAQDVESGRPPERRHAQLVHAEVGRLNELLERTLQFSRPLELRREPVDVSDLLRRAVERLQAPNGRLMTDLATDLPPVSSDPDLLFQVFGNLLRNGIEAAREVLASTRRDGNCVIVRVLSRGARIPPEIEARLFQPFVTSKPHGTGLGLALCRKIATAHDAEIDGRNCDEGVLFELRLPA